MRLIFLVIAVFAFGATEFGRHVYRPWAYARGLNDLGLADSIGNLGGIVVQVFFTIAVVNATRAQSYRWAAFLSIGYVAYEFVQPHLPKGIFDWKDVAATGLGYCVGLLVLRLIWGTMDTARQEDREP
jgi:hypothetical protein